MYENFGLFIDGDWRTKGGHGSLGVVDPATGETIGTVPAADERDVEEAIAAAEAGFRRWRSTPAWTRADLLHAAADAMQQRSEEAVRRITLETGKTARPVAAGMGPSGGPVPLVCRRGAAHLRPDRRKPRSRRADRSPA